jgi:hypothetical protein
MMMSRKNRIIELEQDNRELRKELEKYQKISLSLRDLAYQYKATLDSFNGFIYISSPDYVIEFMNDKLTDRIGKYSYGTKCYYFIFGRDRKCPWCLNDKICKGESLRWELKSTIDNKLYYIINNPIDYYDNYTCNLTIIQDITNITFFYNEKQFLKRIENEWNRLNDDINVVSNESRQYN